MIAIHIAATETAYDLVVDPRCTAAILERMSVFYRPLSEEMGSLRTAMMAEYPACKDACSYESSKSLRPDSPVTWMTDPVMRSGLKPQTTRRMIRGFRPSTLEQRRSRPGLRHRGRHGSRRRGHRGIGLQEGAHRGSLGSLFIIQDCRVLSVGHLLIMARHLRVEFPGAIYHVSVRMLGNAPPQAGYDGTGWKKEESLYFEDDSDRERLLGSPYHVKVRRPSRP